MTPALLADPRTVDWGGVSPYAQLGFDAEKMAGLPSTIWTKGPDVIDWAAYPWTTIWEQWPVTNPTKPKRPFLWRPVR